jgi:hypothetical protein
LSVGIDMNVISAVIDSRGQRVNMIKVHFMNGDTKDMYVGEIHKDLDGIIHFVGGDGAIICSAPPTGIAYWD